jgi:hypothetical protein
MNAYRLLLTVLSRYFFKLDLLQKGSVSHLDLDEEEDIAWDSAEKQGEVPSAVSFENLILPAVKSSQSLATSTPLAAESDSEIEVLKGHIRSLATRIVDLERTVSERNEEIRVLQETLATLRRTESVTISPAAGSMRDSDEPLRLLESASAAIEKSSAVVDVQSAVDISDNSVLDKPVGSSSNLANLDDEDWENSWS